MTALTAAPLAAPPRRRRSRAKPKPPRPRAVVMAELRAVLGIVFEQAQLDGLARPVPSVAEWVAGLAAELEVAAPGECATYRELYFACCAVIRDGQDGVRAAA